MLHTYVQEPAIPFSVFIEDKPTGLEEYSSTKSKYQLKDSELEEQVLTHLPTCRKE